MGSSIVAVKNIAVINILEMAFEVKNDEKNKYWLILPMLPEKTIQQRFRRNAMELSAHVFYFLYELLAVLAFTLSIMYTGGN